LQIIIASCSSEGFVRVIISKKLHKFSPQNLVAKIMSPYTQQESLPESGLNRTQQTAIRNTPLLCGL
jgi:hypothetical protein